MLNKSCNSDETRDHVAPLPVPIDVYNWASYSPASVIRSGVYTLTIQERAYVRFQILSFLGKDVIAHDVYTEDELRTFCA